MLAEKIKNSKIKNEITVAKYKVSALFSEIGIMCGLADAFPPFVLKSKKKNIIRGVDVKNISFSGTDCVFNYNFKNKAGESQSRFIRRQCSLQDMYLV